MIQKKPDVVIYTDGASRGNPGPGGYGTILIAGQHRKELSGGFRLTTNNRMELLAVIKGLEALKKDGMLIYIYSDSKYVVQAVNDRWLDKWIATQFKGGKKNKDLWLQFDRLRKKHQLKMIWVKGHADNPLNNRCDELATLAADLPGLPADEVFEQEQHTR